MKRHSFPLWLLRDVPSLRGCLASFWALIIFAVSSGNRVMRGDSIGKQVRDHFALMLAHAEGKLDQALWRKVYRRPGWNPSLVRLHIIAPTILWSDTEERLAHYAHAFRNMNRVVDAYVDDLRECYSIARRHMTDGLYPLRHATASRATSPGFAVVGKQHCSLAYLSAKDWGRWVARVCERDGATVFQA